MTPLRSLMLAAILTVPACSAQHDAPAPPPAPAHAPDRFIYVSAAGVPDECYHDLGPVSFTEPYTSAAMDGDGVDMANKLRALAMQKYPDQADAVINVRTEENSVGTVVTVNGDAVELHQGHTVECAMRKAPGVLDRAAAVAAGGMIGAVAGGLITGGTGGMMVGGGAGAGAVATYMGVKQHLETKREQAQLKKQLASQQSEIARLLAKRSSLQKCADDDIALANCKVSDTIAAAADPAAKPAEDPSYETEQPQFELQKQVEQQQDYIRKLRDQVFELQEQLGGRYAGTQ
ncbi:MAG TPA: hypothetical protein VMI09_03050 [Candidatus Binataceae bacterium]|nr:hypothetical protein [Candidatus Binataceae bacterium]